MVDERTKFGIVHRPTKVFGRTGQSAPYPFPWGSVYRRMITLRTLPTLLAAVAAAMMTAQTPIRIVDPMAIDPAPGLDTDKDAMAALQAAGLADGIIGAAIGTSQEVFWPVGLRGDSARSVNKEIIRHYVAVRVCDLGVGEHQRSLIGLYSGSNVHMPEDLRPSEDIFLVVADSGLMVPPPVAIQRTASKGPNWARLPKARIRKADEVYATYDLSRDPAAIAALEKRGMSKAEIEAVLFRSHESNWPEGIASFEKRYPRLKDFKRYKAYQAARWDGKALLIIPSEPNRKVPESIRPYLDVYMVYTAEAVDVRDRSGR